MAYPGGRGRLGSRSCVFLATSPQGAWSVGTGSVRRLSDGYPVQLCCFLSCKQQRAAITPRRATPPPPCQRQGGKGAPLARQRGGRSRWRDTAAESDRVRSRRMSCGRKGSRRSRTATPSARPGKDGPRAGGGGHLLGRSLRSPRSVIRRQDPPAAGQGPAKRQPVTRRAAGRRPPGGASGGASTPIRCAIASAMCRGKFFVGRLGAVFAGVVRRVAGAAQRVGEIRCLALLDPLLETPQRRPLPHVRGRHGCAGREARPARRRGVRA
jgi:hypothetical protein